MRLLALSIPFLLLSGCAGTTKGFEELHVDVGDDFFAPDEADLLIGDKLSFRNSGLSNHTVTIHVPPNEPDEYELNEELGPGESVKFEVEFEQTYHVFCRFHGAIGSGMHLN